MDQETRFLQAVEVLTRIEEEQRLAMQHYDEGILSLGYVKFANETLQHQLTPNAMQVSPAFLKCENHTLVESDRSKFTLIPHFSEKQSWSELSPEEYEHETQELLSAVDASATVFASMGLSNEIPSIHRIKEEFTQSLQHYLKVAEILTQLRTKN